MKQVAARQADYRCTLEKEGFLGSFYQGEQYADRAIILVGGSGEGREFVEKRAEILSREGFSVLAVGYYLWKPLPKDTVAIPVDYVEYAVKWLQNDCPVEIHSIGMTGLSLGAAYTLVAASLIPDISCAVSVSGFDFVVEGCKSMVIRQHRSYFTFHGEDVPYEPAEALSHLPATLKAWKKDPRYGSKAMNRFYYNECFKDRTEKSRIKVENIHGDVLLMSPGYDDTWPSDKAFPRIMKILDEKGFPYRHEYAVYEKGSHCLAMPEEQMVMIGSDEKIRKALGKFITMEAEYPEECKQARKDSWARLVDFFRESMTKKTPQKNVL